MKDNFSSQPDQYRAFRPTYPEELYEYLLSLVSGRERAWDCGTGNGQVAVELAKHFQRVDATDISDRQLEQAGRVSNIFYSVQRAEETDFPENAFDLITVAQAIHWFDFERFYVEVNRTAKNKAIIAVIGYGLLRTFPESDRIIRDFYHRIVGPFWDEERKYVEEKYQTIPWPYQEIVRLEFDNVVEWSFEHLTGYLGTWSAVKHYRNKKNRNPLEIIYDDLKSCWNEERRKVRFPVFARIARIEKGLGVYS